MRINSAIVMSLMNVFYLLSKYAQSKAAAVSIQRINAVSKDKKKTLPAIAFFYLT